ncbi:MAG: hypothetical protein M1840_001626 [Geoglossum simile]|nr:MAG: hypothetical protein M1840_001626 [Geoglossum simile]
MNTPEPAYVGRVPVRLPRIAIHFCTQCKWMLRAAYYAQELLSTFSATLGEVSLIPATGGLFLIEIQYLTKDGTDGPEQSRAKTLWDRKAEGGFPETKELKKRVRDCVEPGRDLGHVDRKKDVAAVAVTVTVTDERTKDAEGLSGEEVEKNILCEDCVLNR